MHCRELSLDVITFCAAISMLRNGGQQQCAKPSFDEWRRRGVSLDVISFSAAISACEKIGKVQH
eukprot:12356446-Karenia_brevis.AAC.1